MASITTRAGKGTPLTNAELDANFSNLNTELGQKLPLAGGTLTGNLNITASGTVTNTWKSGAANAWLVRLVDDLNNDGYSAGASTLSIIRSGNNYNSIVFKTDGTVDFPVALTHAGSTVLDASNYTSYAMSGAGYSANQNLNTSSNVQFGTVTLTTDINLARNDGTTPALVFQNLNGLRWIYSGGGNYYNVNLGVNSSNQFTIGGNTTLHAGNYTSYSPSLTGSGASGSWGISVTGSARLLDSAHYIARTGTSGNLNTDFQNVPAGSMRHAGDDPYPTNNPGGTWWFYDHYRHSNSSNYWGTQVAWGWEDNSCRLAQRNVSGNSWSGWVYYLNSGNYTSYAPSLTGSGASGTWGISITGTSRGVGTSDPAIGTGGLWVATSSGLNVARNNTAYTVLDAGNYSSFVNYGNPSSRGVYQITNWNQQTYQNAHFLSSEAATSNAPSTDYTYGFQTAFHRDGASYRTQMVTSLYSDTSIWVRNSVDGDSWRSWKLLLHSGNYSSYALPLSGGTVSGAVTISAGSGYPLSLNSSSRYQLQIRNTAASAQTYGWWLVHDSGGNLVFHADSVADRASLTNGGTFNAINLTANGNQVLHAGNYTSYAPSLSGGSTIAGVTYFSNVESINLYGIRGRFSNEYIHLYNKVGIGHPSGWGSGEGNTPSQGLSTYGGLSIAYGNGAASVFYGGVSSDAWGASSANNAARVLAPSGASGSWDGNPTGAIKIRLPQRANNTMWRMTVKIYNYNGNDVHEYHIGNYSYSTGGYNVGASFVGASSAVARNVRWGNDGSYDCVWIGETDTSWSYPVVAVTDFTGGFRNGNASNWAGNWDVSIVTSFGTVSATVHPAVNLASGSYVAGNTILHTGNYTSYSPSLTGSGASGTWGISISGNAATVGGRSPGSSSGNLAYFSDSNSYFYTPTWIGIGANVGIFSSSGANSAHFYPNDANYGTWRINGSRGGYNGIEFAASNGNVCLMVDTSSNNTGFYNPSYGWQFRWVGGTLYCDKNGYGGGAEAVVLDSSNYTNYALSLGGGTVTGPTYFRSNPGNGVYLASVAGPPLQAYSNDGGAAYMSFHRSGAYAVNFGLDPDNVLRIGGWSAGGSRWVLDMAGNETLAGSSRAPVFYDSNDTSYFIDPNNSGGVALRTIGEVKLQRNDGQTTHFNYSNGGGSNYIRGVTYFDNASIYTYSNLNSEIIYDQNNSWYYFNGDGTTNLNTVTASRFGTNHGSQNPNNSHPGYGLRVFYSWNEGQANNASSGYSNGITIGSHPDDQAYGFQIVQNMWDDNTYTRRYNGGWQGWVTLLGTNNYTSYTMARDSWNGNLYFNNDGRIYATILYDTNSSGYYCDPASTSRLGTVQADEVYTYGWFRSYNNTGVYNTTYAVHMYAQDSEGWCVTGSGGSAKINFRTNYQSTLFGTLVGNTSYDFGFLNQNGNWRVKVVGGDYVVFDGSSIRSRIVYDYDDTTYYSDKNGGSGSYGLYTNSNIRSNNDNIALIWGNDGNIGFAKKAGYTGCIVTRSDVSIYFAKFNQSSGAINPTNVANYTQTNIAEITPAGAAIFASSVTSNGSPSDERLKENIVPLQNALATVLSWEGVTFDWREGTKQRDFVGIKEDAGVIAQKIQSKTPHIVSADENGELSVRDRGLIAYLIEAVKEQQQQIEAMRAEIIALKLVQ